MKKVIISSPFATQSGYGHHAREFIANMFELAPESWDIKLISQPWGHTPFSVATPPHWTERVVGLPLTERPNIWVQITVPNEFQPVGDYNIGVTAGTEGSICPEDWIDHFNAMDQVVVPSKFTRQVIVDSADHYNKELNTPITVISEYFNESIYTPTNQETSIDFIDEIPERFTFLAVGHWLQGNLGEDRKNLSGLVYSFFEAYGNRSGAPALILKTSGATYSVTDRWEIEDKIRQIQDIFGDKALPRVYLLHGDLTDLEMNALYNHDKVKAMISFTKAEGFGRPLLEFATTGKPIIAPHYSGQADFLQENNICKLAGQLTEIHPSAQNKFLIAGAKWFSADYKYAKSQMKDVQKNYSKWLKVAKRQQIHVNNNFSKSAVQSQYQSFIDAVEQDTKDMATEVALNLPKLDLPTLDKK